MDISVGIVISIITLLGALAGTWIAHTNRFAKLETRMEHLEGSVVDKKTDIKELVTTISTLTLTVQDLRVEVAEIRTYIELKKPRT